MSEMTYASRVEETMYIDLPHTDGLRIKGILRGALDGPLVVMMHGRPGSGNELLQYLGARYLHEKGFSTLRLFMYDFEPTARDLLDTSLEDHAQDFDTVIRYLRGKNVPKIFALGHSYGGLTILKADEKLDAAVLWDPTHGLVFHQEELQRLMADISEQTYDDIVVTVSGYGYIESSTTKDYNHNIGDNSEWAGGKGYPLQIISAGKGIMTELGKSYINAADEPKQQVVIPNATHSFEDSDEVMLQLFKETSEWFERFK